MKTVSMKHVLKSISTRAIAMKYIAMTLMALLSIAAITFAAHRSFAADAPKEKDTGTPVSIKGMAFDPASVSIKVGQTVTWTNNDDRDHSVVATNNTFNSGNISRGGTFSHTFDKAGTFEYACQYHPRMKGTVVVQ